MLFLFLLQLTVISVEELACLFCKFVIHVLFLPEEMLA